MFAITPKIIEGKRGENGGESIFKEIITDSFLELRNNVNPQIQESKWVPSIINKKKSTPRNIVVKLQEPQTKILKSTRDKRQRTYNRKKQ